MVINLKDKDGGLSGKGLNWSLFGLLDGERESKNIEIFNRIAADINDNSTPAVEAFNKELSNLTKTGQKLGDELVKSGKSLPDISQGFTAAAQSAEKMTFASKAATLGMKALSMAGNMAIGVGIGIAVNLLVTGISKLITAQQDAIDKANELTDTYKSCSAEITGNITSLEKMDDEFARLSKGVDENGKNVSLTADEYARYRDIISEVVDMNPSLIKGYNDEGQELVNNNTLIREAIDLQRELNREKMAEYLNSGEDILAGSRGEQIKINQEIAGIVYGNPVEEGISDQLIGGRDWFGTADTEKANAVLEKFGLTLNDIQSSNIQSLQILVQHRRELVESLQNEGVLDANKAQALSTQIGLLDIQLGKLDAAQQKTSAYLSFWAANDEGNKSWYNNIDTGYLDDFSTSLNTIASNGSMSIAEMQVKVMELGESFAGMQDQIPTQAFEDLQAQLANGTISEEQYEASLRLLLEQLDTLKEAYPELADAINSVGAAWRGMPASVNQSPISFSTADSINSLSTLQEKFSSISSAAKDFADTGKVTMASLAGMSKEFGDLKGYDNLVRVLSDVSPAAEDVESALSSIISEYIAGNDAVKNIDDSTRALVQSTLEEMGVLNAEEIATSALAQAQSNLAAQKFLAAKPDLLNLSIAEMQALFAEADITEQTRQAIFNLTMQKALLADSSLSEMSAEGVQSLLNLAQAAGITGTAIDQLRTKIAAQQAVDRGAWNPGIDHILNAPVTMPSTPNINIPTPKMDWGSFSSAAKSQKEVNEALTEFLALLEHRKSMDEFVENEDEYVKALIYAYQNLTKTEEERRDLAEKIYAAKKQQLEAEKSALEGAAKAAMRKYDEEIKGINKSIGRLDEKIKLYEKEKSNLEAAHNAVIRLLDKEIEKLRTKYDEEKKQIEDKKSKYEQAHSAVMDAIDSEIKKYEEQKTAIDDLYQPQIDAVQEQIDLLKKKNDETKKEIELEKAKAALASANSQKVNQVYKEGVGLVYEADGDAILEAQQRLDELAREKELSDLEDKKTGLETERDDKKGSIDEQIEALQKYKEKWDEILSAFEKQQNIDVANSIFGPNWSADVLNGNLDIMNSFKDGYLEIQQKITDITAEQDAANARAEILEQYKQQWEDELDAYKNAEEERLANVVFYAGWEQDVLSGRQEAFNIFRDEYLNIQDQLTDDTKEREALEADIKRLEQYKEEWQDELDSYQSFEDDKKAIELWGADWESKILNNREEALDEFKAAYSNVQDQIAQISRDSLIPNYNLEESIKGLADANDKYVQSIYDRIAAEEEARAAKKNGYSGEGYASGTSHGKQGWHSVDEFGTEAKMSKMNGNYAFIKDGDVVFNRSQTEFLYNFSHMHQPAMLNMMAEDYMKMAEPLSNVVNVPVTPNVTQVTQHFDNITLPNVKDFQDFLSEISRIGLDARQVNFKQ